MTKQDNLGAINTGALLVIVLIIAAGVIFAVVKNGQPQPSDPAAQDSGQMPPVEVVLNEVNGSGKSGTAVFLEENGQTKVSISITPGPDGVAQPAHIHTGACESLGGVRYPLNDVVNGRSETVVAPAMHFLHGLGQLAVNVHRSQSEMAVNVSCGNVTPAMDRAMGIGWEMMGSGPQDSSGASQPPGAYGSYKNYSESAREAEQEAGNKVVLFFHAPWCPFCRAADEDFKANARKIPQGVAVLKVDYDSETELKTKYGVVYQHTFVQIDEHENQIAKWLSGDTAQLAENVR